MKAFGLQPFLPISPSEVLAFRAACLSRWSRRSYSSRIVLCALVAFGISAIAFDASASVPNQPVEIRKPSPPSPPKVNVQIPVPPSAPRNTPKQSEPTPTPEAEATRDAVAPAEQLEQQSQQPGLPGAEQANAESAPLASAALVPPAESAESYEKRIAATESLPLGKASSPAGDLSQRSSTGDDGWMFQTFFALVVVVAIIMVLRLLLMRMAGIRNVVGGQRLVEVLARTTIGPRLHVIFLRVNQKVIVASQTQQGLNTLMVLEDPNDVAYVLGQVQSSKPLSITQGFKQVMQKVDAQFPEDAAEPEEAFAQLAESEDASMQMPHVPRTEQEASPHIYEQTYEQMHEPSAKPSATQPRNEADGLGQLMSRIQLLKRDLGGGQ